MQLLRLTRHVFTLLALLVAGNTAHLSPKGSRLAESLGLLLGLPLDMDLGTGFSNNAPKFLMDIYNCWSSPGSPVNRAKCLRPVPGAVSSRILEDVNVVKTIKGTAYPSQTSAVYSHNLHSFPSSLSVTFNMSLIGKSKEDTRYAYIRVPKRALSSTELQNIKDRCDVAGGLRLQLFVTVNTTDSSEDVVTLETVAELSGSDVDQEKWVDFADVTHRFGEWLHDSATATEFEVVHTRVIVGRGRCYNKLTPSDLGIGDSIKSSPYIVVFSKSDDSEEAIIKAGLAELAAEATANRNRRQIETAPTTSTTRQSHENTTDTLPTYNITQYASPCRLYTHSISFAELGWSDYILQPEDYAANFCAGTCKFPLTKNYNTTKHSYIQSLASKLNPHLVPPPCCAPHSLEPVTVMYEQATDVFVTHEWKDMRAVSCGCK